jgi:NADH dehydrogenase [ubiquinone] 1 alpha subcomplex assembly factor 7
MTPLAHELRALIEANGPMPVARYMALCLGHPQHGYYTTRDPFGVAGDFTTAPEVSQMFGELIGLWCAELWRRMGAPRRVLLVEMGPGRGTLMQDMLRAAKVLPEFRAALDVQLIETSPTLKKRQQKALASEDVAITWHERPESLPEGPLLAVANEFVDALPVDQFVKTEDGWHERRVGLGPDGKLAFGLDPAPLPALEDTLSPRLRPAPAGVMLERRDSTPMQEIARRIAASGGAGLVIDYGHIQSAFGDTLQAVRGHKHVDPLEAPGEADLTAHVDFEALGEAVQGQGVSLHGPVTQGDFLRRLGIGLRAERLKKSALAQTEAIDAALARLTGPTPGMGELFKALAFTNRNLPALPGFDIA